MKIVFLTLFTFLAALFSPVTIAELKGDFSLNSSQNLVKEGDLLEGTLRLWPVENPDSAEFAKLLNTKLFNTLQLIQIFSVEPSSNNADVLEMKGLFIVHASKYLTTYEMKYKNEIVPIEAPSLKVSALENKAQDFFILDQPLNLSHYRVYILGGLVLLVLLVAVVKRKKLAQLLKGVKKDPRAEAIRVFREKFQNASTREDFERIYATKDEWLPLLPVHTSAYNEFFSVMNQHQYKPAWGSEELREVKNIFDIIRGSFK